MYYVYVRTLETGRERFIDRFDIVKDAINKIANCYSIDTRLGCLGEYYYYIRFTA